MQAFFSQPHLRAAAWSAFHPAPRSPTPCWPRRRPTPFAAGPDLGVLSDDWIGRNPCAGARDSSSRAMHAGTAWTSCRSKNLGNPWVALQGDADKGVPHSIRHETSYPQVRGAAMVHSAQGTRMTLSSSRAGCPNTPPPTTSLPSRIPRPASQPPPAGLSDLPLVEIPPASGQSRPARAPNILCHHHVGRRRLGRLDQDVASALSARASRGGLDSLRYFWTARTPEASPRTSTDVRYYPAHLGKHACC